jgi:hypothetical protein
LVEFGRLTCLTVILFAALIVLPINLWVHFPLGLLLIPAGLSSLISLLNVVYWVSADRSTGLRPTKVVYWLKTAAASVGALLASFLAVVLLS